MKKRYAIFFILFILISQFSMAQNIENKLRTHVKTYIERQYKEANIEINDKTQEIDKLIDDEVEIQLNRIKNIEFDKNKYKKKVGSKLVYDKKKKELNELIRLAKIRIGKLNRKAPTSERDILIELYNNTDGDNWTNNNNWLSDEPLGEWEGIDVSDNGFVTEVNLYNNNLTGSIPNSITDLSELTSCNLGSNHLTGIIPIEINKLENLYVLDLSFNELDGELPESLFDLSSLRLLNLTSNNISGELSYRIGELEGLWYLYLGSNDFSGELPESIWQLSNLMNLRLNYNNFTGEILANDLSMENLYKLELAHNELSGPFPELILQIHTLNNLELQYNNFSGEIPNNINNLEYLRYLKIQGNNFNGEIPESLWQLIYLKELDLSRNNISGQLSSNIGNLSDLEYIDLGNTKLSGNLPESFWSNTKLEHIDLSWAKFSGEISSSIGNLNNLEYFGSAGNYFEGEILNKITNLNSLETIYIDYNSFSGVIPNEISNLTNLSFIDISHNRFNGVIPSSIGNLNNLRSLDLAANDFEGIIPASIAHLPNLRSLMVFWNQLDSIPPDFKDADIDLYFWIFYNFFTFEDLANTPETAIIGSQRTIPLNTTINLTDTTSYLYQLPFDHDILNSTYKWYDEYALIETNSTGTLAISEEMNGNSHEYRCVISNSDFNGKSIYTDAVRVRTKSDCGLFMDFDIEINNCEDAQLFDMTNTDSSEIISWHWNFDDPESGENNISTKQNPTHFFETNKYTYNVELIVKDDKQCEDTLIRKLTPEYPSSAIWGEVTFGEDNPISEGYVLIYLLSHGIISTKVDSIYIPSEGNGKYYSNYLKTCRDYILTAYPEISAYPGVLPRWHDNAYYWYNANTVHMGWGSHVMTNINIDLYEYTDPPSGTSTIGGGIYYINKKGEPVKNIDVVLEYEDPDEKDYQVVGFMKSDYLGKWRFNNLGEGKYKVKVNIPGLLMDSVYTVSINEPNSIITDLNYYVDINSGITTNQTRIKEIDYNPFYFNLIPNPNNGNCIIEIKNNLVSNIYISDIEIFSIDGRLQKKIHINKSLKKIFDYKINLSNFNSGIYLIKVIANNSQTTKKLIIE